MPQEKSLAQVLQQLHLKGYQLADNHVAALPDEALQSVDWRLDEMHRVRQEGNNENLALAIAVSSLQRRMKLVFVEVLISEHNFSPMTLLRRLFPLRQRGARTLSYRNAM